MDKILAPIKQRIIKYLEIQSISKTDFYNKFSVASSNFRGISLNSEVGGELIAKILSEYKDLNPDWLILGKGNMLRSLETPKTTQESKSESEGETVKLLIDKITEQAVEIAELKTRVEELESQNTKTLAFPKPNLAAESELGYKKGKD